MQQKQKSIAKSSGTTKSVGSGTASATRGTGSGTVTGSQWSNAIYSAQSKLNDYLLNGTAPNPNQLYGIPIANDVKVEVRNHKSSTSDSINDNYVTLQIVQNGNVLASEERYYGKSPVPWGRDTTATDTMRSFFKRNSHLFDKIRYKY